MDGCVWLEMDEWWGVVSADGWMDGCVWGCVCGYFLGMNGQMDEKLVD